MLAYVFIHHCSQTIYLWVRSIGKVNVHVNVKGATSGGLLRQNTDRELQNKLLWTSTGKKCLGDGVTFWVFGLFWIHFYLVGVFGPLTSLPLGYSCVLPWSGVTVSDCSLCVCCCVFVYDLDADEWHTCMHIEKNAILQYMYTCDKHPNRTDDNENPLFVHNSLIPTLFKLTSTFRYHQYHEP